MFCSNGLLFREGNICRSCPEGSNGNALLHACYRNSRIATIPLAVSRKRNVQEVLGHASMVITTSELSEDIVRTYLNPKISSCVVPNFVEEEDEFSLSDSCSRNWIALGRFSPEKGFLELIRDWPDSEHLMIVGGGDLEEEIRELARNRNIEIRASMTREKLREIISDSFGLIFPSRWYESDPQVVAEAMRLGLPVVAFNVNSAAHLIQQTGAGAVYTDADSLKKALVNVQAKRIEMSQIARAEFLSRWTKGEWIKRIETLYSDLIRGSKK